MKKLSDIAQNIFNESKFPKTIKHKWNKVEDKKLKHSKCERCKCEKWWDQGFGKLVYQDRFGKTRYRAPECVLPNTKL